MGTRGFKLYGMHWNGRPSGPLPGKVPYDENVAVLGSDLNVFDQLGVRRFVSLAALLQTANEEEARGLLIGWEECDELFLLVDCAFKAPGSVPGAFFDLRVGQIQDWLRCVTGLPVALMECDETHLHQPPALGEAKTPGTLLDLIDLYQILARHAFDWGMEFDTLGRPLFRPEQCLWTRPVALAPFRHRKEFFWPPAAQVALCSFTGDVDNYRRLPAVLSDLPELRRFLAVGIADVSVTPDMDVECQRFFMLLNQMYAGVLAVHGVKVFGNLRVGCREGWDCLPVLPDGVFWATGSLGCELFDPYEAAMCAARAKRVGAGCVGIYGRRDDRMLAAFRRFGVNVKRFDDHHTASKRAYARRKALRA